MPPYWFVFDMDETLTHVSPYRVLLCSLFPGEFAAALGRPTREVPAEISQPLEKAYNEFLAGCARAEMSGHPLGILRPGMREIFQRIGELKDAGIAGGCMIYSNNRTRRLLEFMKDLIGLVVGRDDLLLEIVHAGDERRGGEGNTKRIHTILKLLREGPYRAADVTKEDIFFFDDIDHPDIREKIGDRYIRVYPYDFRVNTDRVLEIYIVSLRKAGFSTNPGLRRVFFNYIMGQPCYINGLKETDTMSHFRGLMEKAIDEQITRWNKSFGPHPRTAPREANNSLRPILTELKDMKGGRRRTRKRRRV